MLLFFFSLSFSSSFSLFLFFIVNYYYLKMFHSSSFRHEQYLIRSGSGSKHTLHKKLPSLDSKISAVDTDSECSSSSSSPTYSTVSSPTLATSFSTTTSTLNTSQPKKDTTSKKKKENSNYLTTSTRSCLFLSKTTGISIS